MSADESVSKVHTRRRGGGGVLYINIQTHDDQVQNHYDLFDHNDQLYNYNCIVNISDNDRYGVINTPS